MSQLLMSIFFFEIHIEALLIAIVAPQSLGLPH